MTAEADRALLVVDVERAVVERTYPTEADGSHMVDVSPDGSTAYVANIGSGTLTRISLAGGATLSMPSGEGTEGIDVSPDGAEVWATNRGSNTVTVFDARTMALLGRMPSGDFPIRVKITPDNRLALVSNARSGDLRVFDRATRSELGVVNLVADSAGRANMLATSGPGFDRGTVPVGVLVSPDSRLAWVALTAADAIAEVDLIERRVSRIIRAGREPDGLAYVGRPR